MLVSLIINNYNYDRFLRAAIDSALHQSHPYVEVIVVDDGSTDHSRATIERYTDRLTAILKENGGQSTALTAGFAQSHGDIVIFLDADDVLLPHAARAVVEAYTAQPAAAKIQYRMAVIDRNGQPLNVIKPPQHIPLPSGDLRHQELAFPFDLAWLPTSGNAFSASVLRRILPIPDDYGVVGADWYLAHVAALHGPVVTVNEVCAHYRVHADNYYEQSAPVLDLAHVRQTLAYADHTRHHLQEHAAELGLPDRPAEILSVSYVANRLASFKLARDQHPVTDDSRTRLFRLALTAVARRSDVSWLMRLMFRVWFAAVILAPAALARWLIEVFFFPERRRRLNSWLGSLHAAGQVAVLLLIGQVLLTGCITSPEKSIYWGAWINGDTYGLDNAPWEAQAIDAFESHAGKQLSILHWGQAWWRCTPTCRYQSFQDQSEQYDLARQRGIIPLIDWASWDSTAEPRDQQPNFTLSKIIAGDHDQYIRQWATAAKNWGHPFFLRFNWEMNGDWFPWSEATNNNRAGQYVLAWRHVHAIFAEVGATNITWVWCPNVDYPGGLPLDSLYPGDAYVDWVCMDGYNWGTNQDRQTGWQSFQAVFGATYDQLGQISPTKPIMIAETSSTEAGGSKAEWITDALTKQLPVHFPKVKALVWFNWNTDGMDWVIESSPSAQAAFAQSIASTYYAQSQFANLNVAPIPPLDQLPQLCLPGQCIFLSETSNSP